MKTRKIRVTAKKADELVALFRTVPAEPVGNCLSDDEFIGYATETLPKEDVRRIDAHLASCLNCATEAERLLEASRVWSGEQGKQRLAALRARLEGQLSPSEQPATPATPPLHMRLADALQQAKESLQALLTPKLAWEAATDDKDRREIWDWQSQDGILSEHCVLARNGDLMFRFASKELGLEGVRFSFRLGSLQREVVLRRVSETEVGARIVIPRHQRPSNVMEVSFKMSE